MSFLLHVQRGQGKAGTPLGFLVPFAVFEEGIMAKNCSEGWFWSETLPGLWVCTAPMWDGGQGRCVTLALYPQKNAKQRGIWVTPPLPLFLWCSVLSVRTRQGSGASFRAVWASQPCTRGQKPSRRLVLQHKRSGRKIVSWGEYGSLFFADKGHGLSRYPYYPGPWYNYFIWPIAQAILCGQEMFSVCAGPPPRKTLAWFSLAELQTVPLTIFPFCLFPLPHSHSFIPSVSRF